MVRKPGFYRITLSYYIIINNAILKACNLRIAFNCKQGLTKKPSPFISEKMDTKSLFKKKNIKGQRHQ